MGSVGEFMSHVFEVAQELARSRGLQIVRVTEINEALVALEPNGAKEAFFSGRPPMRNDRRLARAVATAPIFLSLAAAIAAPLILADARWLGWEAVILFQATLGLGVVAAAWFGPGWLNQLVGSILGVPFLFGSLFVVESLETLLAYGLPLGLTVFLSVLPWARRAPAWLVFPLALAGILSGLYLRFWIGESVITALWAIDMVVASVAGWALGGFSSFRRGTQREATA